MGVFYLNLKLHDNAYDEKLYFDSFSSCLSI